MRAFRSVLWLFRTCWINPRCRSMPINKDQRMQVIPWVNLAIGKSHQKGYQGIVTHTKDLSFLYRHIIGALDSFRNWSKNLIWLNKDADQCWSNSLWTNNDQYWSALIFIDQNWSTMIFIDPHWDQFLNSDLYWSTLIGIGDWSSVPCNISAHQFHRSKWTYFFQNFCKMTFWFTKKQFLEHVNSVPEYLALFMERGQSNIKGTIEVCKWLCMYFCLALWPVELVLL